MSTPTENLSGKMGKWLAIISTVITISLTVLNSIWSREISQVENDLKLREAKINEAKERLARYTFVHTLFDGVLNQDEAQKTLTVNLITLALTENESEKLFAGLQASDNPSARDVGNIGNDALVLQGLVRQMNDAVRKNRTGAAEELIKNHASDPRAIKYAIEELESPKLEKLSASGRINVFVFLSNTNPSAWTPDFLKRTRDAIANIRERSARGVAAIGSQTEEALQRLESFLDKAEG